MKKLYVAVVCAIYLSACEPADSDICPKKNCSDFSSHSEAQSAYDADPDCYRNLDRDKDGVAV